MVKLVGVKPEGGAAGALLILGVTAEDFAKGLAGKSLIVDPSELGLPWPGSIVLLFGATAEGIVEQVTCGGRQLYLPETQELARKKVEEAIYGKTKN